MPEMEVVVDIGKCTHCGADACITSKGVWHAIPHCLEFKRDASELVDTYGVSLESEEGDELSPAELAELDELPKRLGCTSLSIVFWDMYPTLRWAIE